MNDKFDRLEDIKIENFVWLIYIGIILLSYYANYKEKTLYYIEMKKVEESIKVY